MRRFLQCSCLATVLALSSVTAWAQAKGPLVGAWKVTAIENPGGAPLLNPQPGLYIFTQRHYSAVRLNGTKPLPDYPSNDVATPADKAAVFDMLYMNTGSYSVSSNRLTMSPMVAKSAFAMQPGRTLEYEFTVKGDTLTLVQKPKGPGLTLVRVE